MFWCRILYCWNTEHQPCIIYVVELTNMSLLVSTLYYFWRRPLSLNLVAVAWKSEFCPGYFGPIKYKNSRPRHVTWSFSLAQLFLRWKAHTCDLLGFALRLLFSYYLASSANETWVNYCSINVVSHLRIIDQFCSLRNCNKCGILELKMRLQLVVVNKYFNFLTGWLLSNLTLNILNVFTLLSTVWEHMFKAFS